MSLFLIIISTIFSVFLVSLPILLANLIVRRGGILLLTRLRRQVSLQITQKLDYLLGLVAKGNYCCCCCCCWLWWEIEKRLCDNLLSGLWLVLSSFGSVGFVLSFMISLVKLKLEICIRRYTVACRRMLPLLLLFCCCCCRRPQGLQG